MQLLSRQHAVSALALSTIPQTTRSNFRLSPQKGDLCTIFTCLCTRAACVCVCVCVCACVIQRRPCVIVCFANCFPPLLFAWPTLNFIKEYKYKRSFALLLFLHKTERERERAQLQILYFVFYNREGRPPMSFFEQGGRKGGGGERGGRGKEYRARSAEELKFMGILLCLYDVSNVVACRYGRTYGERSTTCCTYRGAAAGI